MGLEVRLMWKPLILVLALGTSAVANAQTGNASDFLSQYDAADQTGRQILEMFILGQERGMLTANQYLQVHAKPVIYCPPADTMLVPGQIIDMLRTTVASDGRIGAMPLQVAVLMTLQRNYPCAANSKPKT